MPSSSHTGFLSFNSVEALFMAASVSTPSPAPGPQEVFIKCSFSTETRGGVITLISLGPLCLPAPRAGTRAPRAPAASWDSFPHSASRPAVLAGRLLTHIPVSSLCDSAAQSPAPKSQWLTRAPILLTHEPAALLQDTCGLQLHSLGPSEVTQGPLSSWWTAKAQDSRNMDVSLTGN